MNNHSTSEEKAVTDAHALRGEERNPRRMIGAPATDLSTDAATYSTTAVRLR